MLWKRAGMETPFTAPLFCAFVNSRLARAIPKGSQPPEGGYRFLPEDGSSLLGPVVVMSRASVDGSS
jgi:hypothetical protein